MDAGYHLNCEHNEGYCGADQCSTCEHGPNKCLTCAWWDEILDNKGQGVMHGLCLLHDNDPTGASDVCGCWMSPSETLDKLRTAQAEVARLREAFVLMHQACDQMWTATDEDVCGLMVDNAVILHDRAVALAGVTKHHSRCLVATKSCDLCSAMPQPPASEGENGEELA